jgi:glyoxylase-like metal-dependent hydrolase (beta-lactamase superfamily II)
MRLLQPADGILAFYDGREGEREREQLNWLDDGALLLGIASYAIVDGDEALVYDTHLSVDRARWIRDQLDATRITVVLSHRHIDHVAGTEAFADCDVLAGPLTAKLLGEQREAIEAATPPVKPLVLPTGEVPPTLQVGATTVQALAFDIHAADHTLLWLPERRILLAADAVEDPIPRRGARPGARAPGGARPARGAPSGGHPPGPRRPRGDRRRRLRRRGDRSDARLSPGAAGGGQAAARRRARRPVARGLDPPASALQGGARAEPRCGCSRLVGFLTPNTGPDRP